MNKVEINDKKLKQEKFNIVNIYDEFPRIISIDLKNSDFNSNIMIYESPFGNCQTFTIGNAYKLHNFSKKDVIDLFKIIYNKFGRRQVLIDLKDEYNDLTLKAIACVTSKKYCTPYISTNESNMNLNLIQLDFEKLENN